MKMKITTALLAAALCAPLASLAQSPAGAGPSAPAYSDAMAHQLDAAPRLRDAIQAMAQQPAGTARNQAIRTANEALIDAQNAMLALPPELREGSGKTVDSRAMRRLEQAAQQLREAVQAMAQQPAGAQRNEAARMAREALRETQQAMVDLL